MAEPNRNLAPRAKKLAAKSGRPSTRGQTALEHQWTDPQRQLLELIGRGVSGPKAAKLLLDVLAPNKAIAKDQRERQARKKVRVWTRSLWFRDALWNHTTTKVDLETGPIMMGMVKAAKRGRVDAAKLALAVAGRYTDGRDQQGNVNVQVVFAQMPRPHRDVSRLGPADVEIEDADEV